MKIMVFLHGTVTMHRGAVGRSREERVRQVIDGNESLFDFEAYVPVGHASERLNAWRRHGAEIVYLSSHKDPQDVESDRAVIRAHGFPDGPIFFRQEGEEYHDVAERVLPDVLVEDDCESIGGDVKMTYPHIRPDLKPRICGVVVPEFGGIDHLPDDPFALLAC